MADSFQKEIPKARVNITLDVETNGAKKKVELPLKMVVAGDFSSGKAQGLLAEREKINVNQNNVNDVMAALAPEIDCVIPNKIHNDGSELRVKLKLDHMKQLKPDAVAMQIPEVKNLLSMRNLLKDLKANLVDNRQFQKKLENVLQSEDVDSLRKEVGSLVLQDVVAATEAKMQEGQV